MNGGALDLSELSGQPTRPEDLPRGAAACRTQGHDWAGDGLECARCGKPSAIPRVDLCRHGEPLHWRSPHDCEYSDAREALIPYAEAAADQDVPEQQALRAGVLERATPAVRRHLEAAVERYAAEWSRAFHAHMARLAALARAFGRA